MKSSGLIVAAVVLAGLVGLLYWSNRHKPADNTNTLMPRAETAPQMLTLNEADINKIELRKKDSEPVVLQLNNGAWEITAPSEMKADQPAVTSLLSAVSSLSADRVVEEKAPNLAPYGLAAPQAELTLTDKNNVAHKVLIGDDTPTSNANYAKLENDPRVFTIASFTRNEVVKSLDDLREKPSPSPTPSEKPSPSPKASQK
jgi:hypothetical protein